MRDEVQHMSFLFSDFFLQDRVLFGKFSMREFFLRRTLTPNPTDLQLHLAKSFNITQKLDLHGSHSVLFILVMKISKRGTNIDHILAVGANLGGSRCTL